MMILLSVLMVLSVGMSVSAEGEENVDEGVSVQSSGAYRVGVRYSVASEASNEMGNYAPGEEVTIEAKTFEGYTVASASATVYSNYNDSLSVSLADNKVTFTMPTFSDGTASVVVTFYYNVDEKVADSVDVDGAEGSATKQEQIAIAELATGVKVEEGDDVKYSPVKNTAAEAETNKIENFATNIGLTLVEALDVTANVQVINENGEVKGSANSADSPDLKELAKGLLIKVEIDIPKELVESDKDLKLAMIHVDKNNLEKYYTYVINKSDIKQREDGTYYYEQLQDMFSTFGLAYGETTPTPTPEPTPTPSPVTPETTTPTTTEETKAAETTESTPSVSYAKNDKNHDGVVTCDEEMGDKNWVWNNAKGACVYRVTNTSAK